ncbi:hypothetical protein F4819DRAFT_481342 [Hypoxylon fuscum]|nr:hypothetical protein F4819DRAFT_481342 [Hypoxylon fuscum]
MSQTPVKVPPSAAAYTPATRDPDLRSEINMQLLREGYVTKIQDTLLHSLDAHPSNWPAAVQSHALALLRNGDVSTFPALVRRVLEDVRQDTAAAGSAAASDSSSNTMSSNGSEVNGAGANGNSSKTANGNGNSTAEGTLAIPESVVEAVLKVTRECLDAVCEIDANSTAG